MRGFAALIALLQGSLAPPPPPPRGGPDFRAALDTLYAGDFETAARTFAALAAGDSAAAAPVIFQAGAYIWWASALDSAAFERERIDSLLGLAVARARHAGSAADFWLATAHGYRARERDLHGHTWGAARDGKAMRDAYRRVLRADSTCVDCYLGLGVYHYGLARAGAVARLLARVVGLGSGNADTALVYLRRVAEHGDLARVEATWVLAAALVREGERAEGDPAARDARVAEARELVRRLALRFPGNPVFQRFLDELRAAPSDTLQRVPGAAPR